MEAAAHTPGPWKATDRHVTQAETGNWIADCDMHSTRNPEANARLIAAAPDLLAALERLMQSQRDSDAECVSGSAGDYCLTHEYEAWPCPVDSARALLSTLDGTTRGEKVQG